MIDLDVENHAVLVDSSGGRGQSPEVWARPETNKSVGFAGGLGPANLRMELSSIEAVAKEPWWIDMEERLRDAADWFSVSRAKMVMDLWDDYMKLGET